MAGLVLAIHVFKLARPEDVDARDKRGHDNGAYRGKVPWRGRQNRDLTICRMLPFA
jgi:hypothetical protein